jgi:cation diffusion facilitator family transporter
MKEMNREQTIVRTSVIGIAVNILLSAFKAAIGLLTHSIAIVLDSVNNLSDALSSVITICGTKLAAKPADKKHPYGYGRIEYITAMIIGAIILYAGITSLTESIKKIMNPNTPEYSLASLIIVFAAIFVKIFLGLFVRSTGKKVNSDSLIASGQDALMDSLISVTTLLAAIVFIIWHISLEAWLGLLISAAIIKAGIETIRETVSKILGERINADLSKAVKATIKSVDSEIYGAYDLILNNYGPDKLLGSVHIEIPDTWTPDKIDSVSRKIAAEVFAKHKVMISAIGVYSVNTKQDAAYELREAVRGLVMAQKGVLQMHGFYVDEETKVLRFDLVVAFSAVNKGQLFTDIKSAVKEAYPAYDIQIQFDLDFSD